MNQSEARVKKTWAQPSSAPCRLSAAIILIVCLASAVRADPAVRIVVSNDPCLIQLCPGSQPPPPTTVQTGMSFQVFVAALDAANSRDETYAGSIAFSSSDSGAVLPASYTFTPADRGGKAFTVILSTAGDQTITVTDSLRALTGTLTMTVTAPTEAQVPTLSSAMRFLLLTTLAAVGVWMVRGR